MTTKLKVDTKVIENRHVFWNIKKGRKTKNKKGVIVETRFRRHGVIVEQKGTKIKIWLSDGNVIEDKTIYWGKMW